jgi:hypothetical protein
MNQELTTPVYTPVLLGCQPENGVEQPVAGARNYGWHDDPRELLLFEVGDTLLFLRGRKVFSRKVVEICLKQVLRKFYGKDEYSKQWYLMGTLDRPINLNIFDTEKTREFQFHVGRDFFLSIEDLDAYLKMEYDISNGSEKLTFLANRRIQPVQKLPA